ncbi:MAG: hypothetical protein WCX80_04560 [Patescibacteria group bacterium]
MKKTFNSYKNTVVSWGKSQAEIMKLLGKYGISEIRFTNLNSETMNQAGFEMEKGTIALVLEFFKTTKLSDGLGGRIPIKIIIPDIAGDDKSKNQAFRVFFWYLKNKFIAIDSGLVEFEQEFMPHISIGKGNPLSNMYYAFKDKILPSIVSGKNADIKMIESPKKDN